MEKEEIFRKLKEEMEILIGISEMQFDQRFTTSKFEDKWADDIFIEYQKSKIRVELLLELLT
jgi:hypothetical protein